MTVRQKVLVLLFLCVVANSAWATTIVLVDELKGKDGPSCIHGSTPCLTLQYAVNNTGNNTLFVLASPIITVDTVVKFQGLSGISILGGNNSSIHCTGINCGLSFIRSSNIRLRGFKYQYCSIYFHLVKENDNSVAVLAGLHFDSCRNLYISNVSVIGSIGFGMSLAKGQGETTIDNSSFSNNSQCNADYCTNLYGSGGMLIYAGYGDSVGMYSISNCDFSNNTNLYRPAIFHNYWYFLSYGGGLNVFLSGNVTKNISLLNCGFSNNTSIQGGGMAISLVDGTSNSHVTVHGCHFINNNGSYDNQQGGGGGMKITMSSNELNQNQIGISNCTFIDNKAQYGGGTSLVAGTASQPTNQVTFYECHWLSNTGPTSAAIDISPDYRHQRHNSNTNVSFENCRVVRNSNVETTIFQSEGVFSVSRINVKFVGQVWFEGNQNTALFMYSSRINVVASSSIYFIGNNGSNGGAMQMKGYSEISYDNNVTLKFINNSARFLGGAIYSVNSDQDVTFSFQPCLFKPQRKIPRDIQIIFNNNKAGTDLGESIYLKSINACINACNENSNLTTWENPFNNTDCLGNFTFFNKDSHGKNVTTDVSSVQFINNGIKAEHYVCEGQSKSECVLQVIPGFKTYIALKTTDDYGTDTTAIVPFYVVLLHSSFRRVFLNSTFRTVTTNNYVTIHGQIGLNDTLAISPISYRNVVIKVNFTLVNCPPGYVFFNNFRCLCSALQNESFQYRGINGCNHKSGLLLPGYWAGYVYARDGTASDSTLLTGDCPRSYCNFSNVSNGVLQLLPVASKTELEEQVCTENREGRLCGRCRTNTSVFYHSNTFKCTKEKYCQYGLVFYVLVDLVPTVILFLVLLSFDISLTSGAAYSVIFMMQQIHVSDITDRESIVFGRYQIAVEVVNAIYDFSDLEFLNMKQFSFCLFSGAQTMDILVMKYVSVVFAIMLVFVFTLLMNKWNCSCMKRVCKRNRSGTNYSVVHGLTAFLVICYNGMARVTFDILSKGVVYGRGSQHQYSVAFLDGQSMYFQGDHLKYAIPALPFLVFVIIPIPLILLFDPLLLKLESIFCPNVQPWTKVRIKFKPILDAFQNCFKDNMRWYAGIFFLYRFVYLSIGTAQRYYLIVFFLVLLLTLHSVVQPFASTKHNILGSVCFCNLVLINFFTIRIYSLVASKGYVTETIVYQWIQLCLVYLPILAGFIWIIYKLYLRYKKKRGNNSTINESTDLPEVIFNRSISPAEYGSLKDD